MNILRVRQQASHCWLVTGGCISHVTGFLSVLRFGTGFSKCSRLGMSQEEFALSNSALKCLLSTLFIRDGSLSANGIQQEDTSCPYERESSKEKVREEWQRASPVRSVFLATGVK